MKIYNKAGELIFEGEDLTGANLSGASLRYADLSEADLRGASLRDASLRYADLSGADLSGADLSGASLRDADLSGADLSGADLSDADLSGADLSGADLSGAYLSGAYLSDAKIPEQIASAPIRAEICARVCETPDALKMNQWHTCETVHCLAGWAVHLHPQGAELEAKYGTNVAGALIFHACEGEIPDFYSNEQTAMQWLKKTAQ